MPCWVSVLPVEIIGIAVLVHEYCMEAKMRLAASVRSAVLVQVAMNALSLFFPSLGTAFGAEFNSVIMIGSVAPFVAVIAARASLKGFVQLAICARQRSLAHASSKVYPGD